VLRLQRTRSFAFLIRGAGFARLAIAHSTHIVSEAPRSMVPTLGMLQQILESSGKTSLWADLLYLQIRKHWSDVNPRASDDGTGRFLPFKLVHALRMPGHTQPRPSGLTMHGASSLQRIIEFLSTNIAHSHTALANAPCTMQCTMRARER
jgi:hypothetical protein